MEFGSCQTAITALEFVGNILLVGEGSCVALYDVHSHKRIVKRMILPRSVIHGFIAHKKDNGETHVFTYGENAACIFMISSNHHHIHMKIEKQNLFDRTLDAFWIDDEAVVTISAHNIIDVWVVHPTWKHYGTYSCDVKCLLYSACFTGFSWDSLVAFGGTIFSQVIVWAPSISDSSDVQNRVLQKVSIEKGSVFSVTYCPVHRWLCTSSDDRSVRVFQVNGASKSRKVMSFDNWRTAIIEPLHVFYAHTSRVWKCGVFKDVIISVGEDSTLCFWNKVGLLDRIPAHKSGSIWCMAWSEKHGLLVTGGQDGAVHSWPLEKYNNVITVPHILDIRNNGTDGRQVDFPRCVELFGTGQLILCTNEGYCYQYDITAHKLHELFHDDGLKRYNILTVSPSYNYVAVGGKIGNVVLLSQSSEMNGVMLKVRSKSRLIQDQVNFMCWLNDEVLAVSHSAERVHLYQLNDVCDLEYWLCCGLSHVNNKSHQITSGIIYVDTFICGDNKGNLHFYYMQQQPTQQKFDQTLVKVHDSFYGVSSVTSLDGYVYSTGRDGVVRKYKQNKSNKSWSIVMTERAKGDWAARVIKIHGHNLLVTFRGQSMVLHHPLHCVDLWEVDCGGGHRSWDVAVEKNDIVIVYVKNKIIHFWCRSTSEVIRPQFQPAVHAGAIYSVESLSEWDLESKVIITGGEDTTMGIHLMTISGIRPIAWGRTHSSNVRTIAIGKETNGERLVFSAGGRGQLFAWNAVLEKDKGLPTCYLQELSSHFLSEASWSECKSRLPQSNFTTVDSDVRYMSVCLVNPQYSIGDSVSILAAGCSDAKLRLFLYDHSDKAFTKFAEFSFRENCVLKLIQFATRDTICVGCLTTGGHVVFWDVTSAIDLCSYFVQSKTCNFETHPMFWSQLHSAGINSADMFLLNDSYIILATGGDDNTLVFTVMYLDEEERKISVGTKVSNSQMHSAQITGLKFDMQACRTGLRTGLLFSASIDQILVMWKWSISNDWETAALDVVNQVFCDIPDVQGLHVCPNKSGIDIYVYGDGFQVFHISSDSYFEFVK